MSRQALYVLLLLLARFSSAASATGFQAHVDYATGQLPIAIAIADLNRDKYPDLAIANNLSNTVSILLGNGDGTFQLHVDYATGNGPNSIAVADFDNDGNSDLAIVNSNDLTVSVLLGNGDGTFQPKVDYARGTGIFACCNLVAVSDLNSDGKLDLAVANYGTDFQTGTISIFLGNGDGTFQTQVQYGAGVNPVGVMVGDFNHDANPDLAVLNNNGRYALTILLGNGDGSFKKKVRYFADGNPRVGVVADFDSDGNLDLAIANFPFNFAEIWLGNGDGTFQTNVDYATGTNPDAVAGRDLDGDGKLDLVTANSSSNSVSVLMGNGDGTFQAHVDYGAGTSPNAVAVADLNGDGAPDIAATNQSDNTVSVLLQATSLALSSTALNYGVQLVHTSSAAQSVTLTNIGAITLTISSIGASGDFVQKNNCGSSLAAGASCKIDIRFKPTAKGTRTGALTITDNAIGSPQTVKLAGIGTVVQFSPTGVNFRKVPVGMMSQPQTITLTNVDTTTLNLFGIGISGADYGDFAETTTCGSSLPSGASCAINVTFTPTAKGSRNAVINVNDNGGGNPQDVTLTGTGT